MIIISILISVIIIVLTYILNKRAYDYEKLSQYECGLENFEEESHAETREKFYIKFYIIAIIFLIFDLESIMLYPMTLLFNKNNIINNHTLGSLIEPSIGYTILIIFMVMLILGLIYETKKKVIYK